MLVPKYSSLVVSAVETTDNVGVYWDTDCTHAFYWMDDSKKDGIPQLHEIQQLQ